MKRCYLILMALAALNLTVPAQNKINRYEYWFDNDFASRSMVGVIPVSSLQLVSGIPTTGLSVGLHSFHIRFRDDSAKYSPAVCQFFCKIPAGTSSNKNIVAYEYWYDNNYAGKVSQSVTPQSGMQVISGISAISMADGLHSFNIRFKDDQNAWSSLLSQFFHKIPAGTSSNKNIVAYEYWYDNNYSGKVTQYLAPQSGIQLITNILASYLADGMHLFHIRFKDDRNSWSSVQSHFFQKISNPGVINNKLYAYRYWFDLADSSMVNLNLPIPVNPYQMVQDIYVGNLPLGEHSIHFQFKDTSGQWSSTISSQFDFTGPPGQRTLTTQTISNGQSTCYDALRTITVAGNGITFTVENGGSATMIAGQNILYQPGTTVEYGGYLNGYITTNGQFCSSLSPSMPAVVTSQEEHLIGIEKSSFQIYPNPTTGNFILEFKGEVPTDKVILDVYGMWGEKLMSEMLNGEPKHEFSLSDRPSGVYFIHVISGNKSETSKIIKH